MGVARMTGGEESRRSAPRAGRGGPQRPLIVLDRPRPGAGGWPAGVVVVGRPGTVLPPAGPPGAWSVAGRDGRRETADAWEGRDPAPAGRGAGPILVVDDDAAILATIGDILESEGYPVAAATNGAEALRAIERERPSLVLLDMRMPVLDGWGFARELRRRGLAVPVLVMTAARDAREWAEEIGADGFLAKPFNLPELLDAVERLRGGPGA